jgi:hypothetical protein
MPVFPSVAGRGPGEDDVGSTLTGYDGYSDREGEDGVHGVVCRESQRTRQFQHSAMVHVYVGTSGRPSVRSLKRQRVDERQRHSRC